MTNYPMPEGVEHRVTGWLAADVGVVTNYLMPQGVEHMRAFRDEEKREGCDDLSDAARR